MLIKEFWDNKTKVLLVTRPRRFGKSITLSMLRHFFEKTRKSTSYLFEKSNIWKEERFRKIQGTLPVIFISFKDIKSDTWEEAYEALKDLLASEVYRALHSLESKMSNFHQEKYKALTQKSANKTEFSKSLFFISEVFKEHYKENTLILIDEYDTPITHAYVHGFHDPMIGFMSSLLSSALKGNEHLHRGFMTGVVRTAKDGILSGLNNLQICTMLDSDFSEKFGFTEEETDLLLINMDFLNKREELKTWYNGYTCGLQSPLPSKIYNPWSVLMYLKNSCMPNTYWANTGSTELLERLVTDTGEETQKELKLLMEGKVLENKQINQDVTLLDLNKKAQEPWSFLLFAGYITAISHAFQENNHYYTLAVPNQEIAQLYKKLVINAIGKAFSNSKLDTLLKALIEGDIVIVNSHLSDFVGSMCSSHDLPQNNLERSLHMFVLGLLATLSEKFIIKSNLESGEGRYDILLQPKTANSAAVIIEFKKGTSEDLNLLAEQALLQIREKKYQAQLKDFGYTGKIICYGIAIFKKHLIAKMETLA